MHHLMNIFLFYIDLLIGSLAPLNSFFGNQKMFKFYYQKSYSNLRQVIILTLLTFKQLLNCYGDKVQKA